jgi:hypothetical protein
MHENPPTGVPAQDGPPVFYDPAEEWPDEPPTSAVADAADLMDAHFDGDDIDEDKLITAVEAVIDADEVITSHTTQMVEAMHHVDRLGRPDLARRLCDLLQRGPCPRAAASAAKWRPIADRIREMEEWHARRQRLEAQRQTNRQHNMRERDRDRRRDTRTPAPRATPTRDARRTTINRSAAATSTRSTAGGDDPPQGDDDPPKPPAAAAGEEERDQPHLPLREVEPGVSPVQSWTRRVFRVVDEASLELPWDEFECVGECAVIRIRNYIRRGAA